MSARTNPIIGKIVISKRSPNNVEVNVGIPSPSPSLLVKPMRSKLTPVINTAQPLAAFTTNVCMLKITDSSR